MTFKLFGQNWHSTPQSSSISLACVSENCERKQIKDKEKMKTSLISQNVYHDM